MFGKLSPNTSESVFIKLAHIELLASPCSPASRLLHFSTQQMFRGCPGPGALPQEGRCCCPEGLGLTSPPVAGAHHLGWAARGAAADVTSNSSRSPCPHRPPLPDYPWDTVEKQCKPGEGGVLAAGWTCLHRGKHQDRSATAVHAC